MNNNIICNYKAMSIGENPHWVYGMPFHEPKGNWTMYWLEEYESNYKKDIMPFTNYVDIDPNTICAISHQVDSNGVRVSTNDVVYFPEIHQLFVMKYDFEFDSFIFVNFYNDGDVLSICEIKDKTPYTIVGNITQNFDVNTLVDKLLGG